MFNHESPRRSKPTCEEASKSFPFVIHISDTLSGRRFVTMRVAHAVAEHSLGLNAGPLTLAGVHMRRDWGHAEDYVRGMWLMLQQAIPDDFVFATGVAHSVQHLVETAFANTGVSLSQVTLS